MKIVTEEFEMLFKDYPLYSQEKVKDPLVICKLFGGSATWYLLEYDPVEKRAFCYVTGLCEGCDEFGYISLTELENLDGLMIERDIYFVQKRFSALM